MGTYIVGGFVVSLLIWLGWRSQRQTRERRRIEDALKHLFDHEYRGRHASLTSLRGTLNLPDAAVVRLVSRMQALGLVNATGTGLDLTAQGRQLALQVVRAHRLLERYFADEARLPLSQVHAAAERREHQLSPDDVERLSAALGHPTFDPHGDPIPSKGGDVPPEIGMPVTAWPPGVPACVVHLEDEPPISYAQIVAEGLRVGQVVHILDASPTRVVLTDGENEYRLAPAVAANVFVVEASERTGDAALRSLADWPDDRPAIVDGLDPACQGFTRRRMMDLGFTKGAIVRPVLSTFAGDPRAYLVRGTVVAIRHDQARHILVQPASGLDEGAA